MPFIGNKPAQVPLTSADIADGIITSAKITDATIANVDIANSTIDLTAKVTGTLPTTKGGTGLAALGTVGQALVVNSGATALEFATVGATAGQVIQVVTATDSTSRTTTSSTYVTISNTLSVTITPSSTSNKIFLLTTGLLYQDTAGNDAFATIFKDGTNLVTDAMAGIISGSSFLGGAMSMSYLDSPSSTSALTYQVRVRRNGAGTVYLNGGAVTASITAFEIKG
jgi:hypothetical protein